MNFKTITFIIACMFATQSFSMFKAIKKIFQYSPTDRTIAHIESEIAQARIMARAWKDHGKSGSTTSHAASYAAAQMYAEQANKLEQEKIEIIKSSKKEIANITDRIAYLTEEHLKKAAYFAEACATNGLINEQRKKRDKIERRIRSTIDDYRA